MIHAMRLFFKARASETISIFKAGDNRFYDVSLSLWDYHLVVNSVFGSTLCIPEVIVVREKTISNCLHNLSLVSFVTAKVLSIEYSNNNFSYSIVADSCQMVILLNS